jgi:hypothetical protein
MKRIPSFLIALALGFTTLSAQAGLITDPLGVLSPVIGQGLITDPLGVAAPQPPFPVPSAAPVNVAAASTFLAEVLGSLPADGTLRLSDLFMNPEFFAAAHAAGPAADALRGQIDWLLLTGVIIGFDGMDGSDDLRGSDDPDEVFGENSNGIILGGPGGDTLAPFNPSIILGGPGGDTIILGGPGGDTLAPFNPSIILGGPGGDTIILGGPGGDTVAPFNPSIILGGPGGDTIHAQVNSATLKPFNPSIILGGPGGDTIILGGPGGDTFSNVSAGHRPN